MKPDGIDMTPLAQYQIAIRAGCSSRFHQDEVMRTKPGLRQDSKTPRKNRAAMNGLKLVQEPMAVKTTPQRTRLTVMYLPVGNRCIRMFVGYCATRYPM